MEARNAPSLTTSSDFYAYHLQTSLKKRDPFAGKSIHAHIIKSGLHLGVFLMNNLMNYYMKTGSYLDAHHVFEEMPVRNAFSWNTILSAYAKQGRFDTARRVFNEMPERDSVSWTAMIVGYNQMGRYGCRKVTSTDCGEKNIASNSALRNAGKPKEYGNLGTAQFPNDRVGALKRRKVRSVICSFIVVLLLLLCLGSYEGGEEDYQVSMESKITLKDVKGVDQLKKDLEEIVHYLRASERWSRFPKGVLLAGPTGTGKSMLARAVAGEAGVPFFMTRVSEFDEWSMRLGVRRVRKLFNAAKKRSPCVIFIDGLDAVGRHRRPTESSITWSTLNQLLVELDGFNKDDGIIVFGASNHPEVLDKALVSPGHFDYRLYVPLPDIEGRKEMLKSHLSKVLGADDVNVTTIARGTWMFTGAELADLVNIAAVRAAVDGAKEVSMAHLEYAKDRIKRGAVAWNNYISKEQLRYEKKLRY